MKILLQSKEIMERRPQWTDRALRRFVEPEGKRHSPISRSGKGVLLFDMEKVIDAEKKPEFITYQAKRKDLENV